jgi:hypothetical protein
MLAVKDLQPVELKNGGLLFSVVSDAELVAAPLWTHLSPDRPTLNLSLITPVTGTDFFF